MQMKFLGIHLKKTKKKRKIKKHWHVHKSLIDTPSLRHRLKKNPKKTVNKNFFKALRNPIFSRVMCFKVTKFQD